MPCAIPSTRIDYPDHEGKFRAEGNTADAEFRRLSGSHGQSVLRPIQRGVSP